MIVSFFKHGSLDTVPVPVDITWDKLVQVMAPGDPAAGIPAGRHMIRPPSDKNATPAWSPVEYRAGAARSKAAVLRVNAFVIDFDGGTTEQLKGLAQNLGVEIDAIPAPQRLQLVHQNVQTLQTKLKGLAHVLHTSWSHATDKKPIALRIAVKLSRPVEAADWPKAWRAINAFFGGLCDPATKDASRLFFCAALPAGSDERKHHVAAVDGEALDVDKLIGQTGGDLDAEVLAALGLAADGSQVTGAPVSFEEVNEFAHELARAKSPKKADIGRRLKKMCGGEPFALPGAADPLNGIDNAIFRMCGFLAEAFHDRDLKAIAKMFERSLALMYKRDGEGHSVDDVLAKLERQAEDVRTKRAEQDRTALVARAVRIREAFGNDRVHGYTAEELQAFGDMDHKWVIQHGSSFYIFFDGDYRSPVSEKAVIAAAARDLAPAHTAGVEVFDTPIDGQPRPKSPLALVLDYGAVAHEVVVDITAQRSRFDPVTRTLIEASCPLRVTEAKYVPEVDRWLKAIGSDELEQWIALAVRLDRPCSALYLDGVKGAGKSLLAHGLARLWTTGGPTMAGHALGGNWNDDIARCAIVLADEILPPKIRQSGYTGELREFIQASRRPLARRYKPNATMIGAVRLILAANNRNLLETNESLTPNDITAIAERFLYVHCPQAAADELEKIGGRKVIEDLFVNGDGIAQHALWLAKHKAVPNGRFFFAGSEEIARTLTTQSGIRGSVCTWLCMYLLNAAPADMLQEGDAQKQIFVERGKLYVAAQALAQMWPAYKTNRNPPSPAQAGSALRGLSEEGVHERGGRTFYVVDERNLVTWAEETGYCAPEQIRQALAGSKATAATNNHLAIAK